MIIADDEIAFHEDEVRAQLRRACDEAGSVSAWARAHRISVTAVHDVLTSRNGVSVELARKLGFEKVARFIVKEG